MRIRGKRERLETGKNSEWEDKSERKSGRGKERERERERKRE